jgi:phosphomethylpyrimidine synthase
MKITEDIRRFAAEQGVDAEGAVGLGMEKMAAEFRESGSELYVEAGS